MEYVIVLAVVGALVLLGAGMFLEGVAACKNAFFPSKQVARDIARLEQLVKECK